MRNSSQDCIVGTVTRLWIGSTGVWIPAGPWDFLSFPKTSRPILYCDQQMHNYLTNYHTPKCFDIIVSSIPCQVTQVFQMQLLVIQFIIKMFHYYQHLHLKYLCNLVRYWLQASWGWHDNVKTFRSVIICEIIVHLLVIVQINKRYMVHVLK
jgi:hypothetical protein